VTKFCSHSTHGRRGNRRFPLRQKYRGVRFVLRRGWRSKRKNIGLPEGGTLNHHRPIQRGSAASAHQRSHPKSIIDPAIGGGRGLTTRWITLVTSRDGKRRRPTRAKLTPTRSRDRGRSSGSIGRTGVRHGVADRPSTKEINQAIGGNGGCPSK
jgi:hypothetical protein